MPSAAIARGGLELVREIGVPALRDRTTALGELLIERAEAAGLRVRAIRDPTRRGGILAVEVADPKPVVDGLADRGIIVDYRPGIVRCAPAFYNTEDEVAETVAALDRLVPDGNRR
jgi:kynureninase